MLYSDNLQDKALFYTFRAELISKPHFLQMRKILLLACFAFYILGTGLAKDPVITMTTSKPIGSTISFSFMVVSNTVIQIDFGDGILVDTTVNANTETKIKDTLTGSQTVSIYGDGITYLSCPNNKLTSLDVSKNASLGWLDCVDNNLTSLNVVNNTDLERLYCSGNKLTSLDVSYNTALNYLYCQQNQLMALDLSNNTALIQLYCEENQLTSLDIPDNVSLTLISCDNNQLTSLDVSNNTALTYLFCNQNQLTALNVYNDVALTKLHCFENILTSLNISTNTALTELSCDDNRLSKLDISNNTALTKFFCYNNRLTYATLPLQQQSWDTYSYAPQDTILIAEKIQTGEDVDLSSQALINGHATTYTWKTQSGTELAEGKDYTSLGGITTFLKSQTEAVYCEMTNEMFPDFTGKNSLKTTGIIVSGTEGLGIEDKTAGEYTLLGSNHTLTIVSGAPAQVEVYDINGRKITSTFVNPGPTLLSGSYEGIYIVRFHARNKVFSRKVLIK